MISPVRKRLSNGLPVVLTRIPQERSVEVAVYVRAGPMWESRGQDGLSHFLEHVILKGPRSFASSLAFHRELEKWGIVPDGVTKEEHVFFSFESHPNDLPESIRLMHAAIAEPRFSPEDIAKEKRVVAEEFYTFREENRLGNEMFRLMFPNNHRQFNLIGSLSALRRATLLNVKRFHRTHFHANNLVLCVAGRFSPEKIMPQIRRTWGKLQRGKSPRAVRIVPSTHRRQKLISRQDLPQIEFDLCFPSLAWTHPDYGVTRFLSRIVGESACSRLFAKIREEEALAYDIGSSLYGLSRCGIFDIRGVCSPENLPAILSHIGRELHTLKNKGPHAEEFASCQKALRNAILFGQYTPSSVNDFFGLWELLVSGKRLPDLEKEIERLRKTKLEDIRQMALRTFSPQSACFVAMGPMSRSLEKDIRRILSQLLK